MASSDLIQFLRRQYRLSWEGIHGVSHWARVAENGLRLSPLTGANAHVVELFAALHDACRKNDDHDPGHGPRAAKLATRLNGRFFSLAPPELNLLVIACRHHTDTRKHSDPTVQTCWDADRLDLFRVGIQPDPMFLNTKAARSKEVLRWANARAERLERAHDTLQRWGAKLKEAIP